MPLHDWPETAQPIAAALTSASRRIRAAHALRATTLAAPTGAVVYIASIRGGLTQLGGIVLGAAAAGAVFLWWLVRHRGSWLAPAAARALEAAYSDSRNVVVTAEELARHPDRARPWIRARVFETASHVARRVQGARVVPLARAAGGALIAVSASLLLVAGFSARASDVVRRAIERATSPRPGPGSIVATVTPPAYTGDKTRTEMNPDRIDAVQGSALHLVVGGGGPWRIRFGPDRLTTTIDADRTILDLSLSKSGYLAIEPERGDPTQLRRLVPVMVTPDRAPTIRVEAPGKDLLLPDANAVVGLSASASDDFGLQSLELRYTKASGSGEQFEFHEGNVTLDISRGDARNWTASAKLGLKQLGLGPGDAIIYRVVGRDARPGDAGLASSETFFIEVAGPGQVALAGFELPPDKERYALSQQMIVLKIERLRARERSIDRAALEHEVGNIAAEQRAVRSNFIFLMGGHVEDEEEEAAHSNEIQEGRLENTARKEIVAAIQYMTRAEQGLAAISTTAALPPAKAAVEALQRAFGRNRYFLRTLPVRSRVDPSRRLTGELAGAAGWKRELLPPSPDEQTRTARDLVARLLGLASSIRDDARMPVVLSPMAEEALAVDPSSDEWRAISTSLVELRDAAARSRQDRAKLLNRAVTLLLAETQRRALPVRSSDADIASLRSAWAEEHKR